MLSLMTDTIRWFEIFHTVVPVVRTKDPVVGGQGAHLSALFALPPCPRHRYPAVLHQHLVPQVFQSLALCAMSVAAELDAGASALTGRLRPEEACGPRERHCGCVTVLPFELQGGHHAADASRFFLSFAAFLAAAFLTRSRRHLPG